MTAAQQSYDTIWDSIYEDGHTQKAPWDSVVSFVYRHRPRERAITDTRLLEVGCGTASNLRFFAREGFQVWGIDGSSKAIEVAANFFAQDGVSGNLSVGDFTNLPYDDDSFDLAIDRAALTCCGRSGQIKAIREIHRCLQHGGKFLFTPYASTHSSRTFGTQGSDGLTLNISAGSLIGVGQICFASEDDIRSLLPDTHWNILSVEYQTSQNIMDDPVTSLHASWRVIAQKI